VARAIIPFALSAVSAASNGKRKSKTIPCSLGIVKLCAIAENHKTIRQTNMYSTDPHQEENRTATGAESLAEFAFNAGMDHPERCWLLDSRDVWVRNPHYHGPDVRHPEDDF